MPLTPHSCALCKCIYTLARGKILLGAHVLALRRRPIPSEAVSILETSVHTEAWLQAALCY